jgi:hypothetical protein
MGGKKSIIIKYPGNKKPTFLWGPLGEMEDVSILTTNFNKCKICFQYSKPYHLNCIVFV